MKVVNEHGEIKHTDAMIYSLFWKVDAITVTTSEQYKQVEKIFNKADFL